MSNLRKAAEQALQALEGWEHCEKWVWPATALEQAKRNTTESLAALRTALEQQQQAEPVHGDIRALKYRIHELEGEVMGYKRMLDVAEAASQQKPLTINEVEQILAQHNYELHGDRARYIVRMTEEAHGIKGEE